MTVGRADLYQTNLVKQLVSGVLLELVPQSVAVNQQRHVVWVLKIGLANDARLAVRAAAVVWRLEAIDAEHLRRAGQDGTTRRYPRRRCRGRWRRSDSWRLSVTVLPNGSPGSRTGLGDKETGRHGDISAFSLSPSLLVSLSCLAGCRSARGTYVPLPMISNVTVAWPILSLWRSFTISLRSYVPGGESFREGRFHTGCESRAAGCGSNRRHRASRRRRRARAVR